jgi:hypothetical protein
MDESPTITVPLSGRALVAMTPAGSKCVAYLDRQGQVQWKYRGLKVEPSAEPRSKLVYGFKEIEFLSETDFGAIGACYAMDRDPDHCGRGYDDCYIDASPQFMGVLREALRALDNKTADSEPPSEEGEV